MFGFAVRTDGLTKLYGSCAAVDSLSLSVPRGIIYGFLGCNGAGKTTTIKMLLGLTRPTAGSIQILGLGMPAHRVSILQKTAFVSENRDLDESLTANQLLAFNRSFYLHWSDETSAKYARLLDVPLNKPWRKLSHGNRTKVALLLALAQRAELIILDEPSAGLDPVGTAALLDVLKAEGKNEGRTILVCSHQLSEIEHIADEVGIIDRGRLLLQVSVDRIKRDFRLITATGLMNLNFPTSGFISRLRTENGWRFLVEKAPDSFAMELQKSGARVEVSSLDLKELFLALVGMEAHSCTGGYIGDTHGSASSVC